MALFVVQRAAANAPVGSDLISGETWRISNAPRRLTGVMLTGSAAAGDTKVSLFAGNLRIGEFYNSAMGSPQALRDTFRVAAIIPGGMPLVAQVDDAPATNPIYLGVEIA